MKLCKLLCVLAAAAALAACGEKKLAEPIPDAWAKANCGVDQAGGVTGCAAKQAAQAAEDKATR